MPSALGGCQMLNHQSSAAMCSRRLARARRKLSASSNISCSSERPAGPSIMVEATSSEARMLYCGEVEMCIMNASLKRSRSSWRLAPSCTWIIDAWLNAANSLWVEWVLNTSGLSAAQAVPMA
ncbi:hypothetical protein D9M71_535470 [compost metagenome]